MSQTRVVVLEKHILPAKYGVHLRINPASGVDLPDLDLGVKTPSENYCTSEPFFSAYERLHGTEYDVAALLTDYQSAKKNPPLRLQVISQVYLSKTHIADANLCEVARRHRRRLLEESEPQAKKVFRFLAHINQADWRAKRLLRLIDAKYDEGAILAIISEAERDYALANEKRAHESKGPIPTEELAALVSIRRVRPLHLGIINAADNWVIETHKEFGRYPNDNEWNRLRDGPLDGKIGMSFALQWRFNFGQVFGRNFEPEAPTTA